VLVRCYHGLGNTIQFIRFAAPLRQLARHVVVWSQPAVLDLVSTAAGIDRILPLHDGVPDVDDDVDIEVMELPQAYYPAAKRASAGRRAESTMRYASKAKS
jgi:hypothetical protein